jgi:hypothetical protein
LLRYAERGHDHIGWHRLLLIQLCKDGFESRPAAT